MFTRLVYPALVLFCALLAVDCSNPRELELCELCLSSEGACAEGCCALQDDPVALCGTYAAALCARGQVCAAGEAGPEPDLFFCSIDCRELSACEMALLVAFPVEWRACLDSIPAAPCDPTVEGVGVAATTACQLWEEKAQAAVDDSSCNQDGSGESRIAKVDDPAGG